MSARPTIEPGRSKMRKRVMSFMPIVGVRADRRALNDSSARERRTSRALAWNWRVFCRRSIAGGDVRRCAGVSATS